MRKATVSHPTDVSVLLGKLMNTPEIAHAMDEIRLLESWPNIVGEKIAQQVQVVRIHEGVLYLKTTSSVWRSEVNFAKKAILESINLALGKPLAKDLRFQ